MAAGPVATPAHTHAQLQGPKLGFSIRRLLSGVPCAVNADREREALSGGDSET